MARVKTGPVRRKKHKKILKLAKGYRFGRSKLTKRAKEAVIRAGSHAFSGRKERKRQMRSLWIIRLSAALSPFKLSYSQFINKLKSKNIELDRKILAELATNHPKVFEKLIASVNSK